MTAASAKREVKMNAAGTKQGSSSTRKAMATHTGAAHVTVSRSRHRSQHIGRTRREEAGPPHKYLGSTGEGAGSTHTHLGVWESWGVRDWGF